MEQDRKERGKKRGRKAKRMEKLQFLQTNVPHNLDKGIYEKVFD